MNEDQHFPPDWIERIFAPRTKHGSIRMTDEIRRWIEEIEALPENQSGSDKTWVGELMRKEAEQRARGKRTR